MEINPNSDIVSAHAAKSPTSFRMRRKREVLTQIMVQTPDRGDVKLLSIRIRIRNSNTT